MSDICPNSITCPIFSGVLKGKEFTTKAYKKQYCEAGVEGRNNCMRYQVKQKVGVVPPDLLPNSTKSIDEIIRNIKN